MSASVSIVIPAYNAGAYLGGAVSSAINQDYGDVEVVVVDDGSSDDTARIARSYGDRVVFVQQENRGLAGARNSGIRASSGDVVTLCDADDILLPWHVSHSLAALGEGPGDRLWVSSDAARLGSAPLDSSDGLLFYGVVPPAKQTERILEFNFVSVFSSFPRRMFDEVGGFDERLRRCEDWNFWARAILLGWRTTFVEEPTALYRMTPGSLSADVKAMADAAETMLARLAEEHSELLTPLQLRRLHERARLGSPQELRAQGREALREGDLYSAQAAYAASARMLRGDRRLRTQALLLRLAATPTMVRRSTTRRRGRR